MATGPQPITTKRIGLAFENAAIKASAPAVYVIVDGKLTPKSTKPTTKKRISGNRDPVLGIRAAEGFKISIPMPPLIESNGLGELILAQMGTDTLGSELGTSGGYDHVFTANDTIKSFTLWCWDTLNPLDIRMCVIEQLKVEIDKDKNTLSMIFDCSGAEMTDSSTFGTATYINVQTDKPKMLMASQCILEFGQPQSNVSQFWNKLTLTMKESPKFGANQKAPVPSGAAAPQLVVKGPRDTDLQLDYNDLDRQELKRFRQGVETTPTATAQMDAAGLIGWRLRVFGNEIGVSNIWGYSHRANAGSATIIWGGTYTGTDPAEFEVYVTTDGTPDKFKWRKNNGAWSAEISVTGSAQTLSDGVTVTFSSTTGAALNDTFYGFTHYQRMLELTSLTNVFDDWSDVSADDFYKASLKVFHESGIGSTKPSITLRNTKSTAYT